MQGNRSPSFWRRTFLPSGVLLVSLLAGPVLAISSAPSAAEASALQQRGHNDDCRGDWDRRGRGRDCGEHDRRGEHNRHEGRRHDRGDRGSWSWLRHDDYGDCFRTPWGLACETSREGVYRVRDRHPGDERGPDCDVLIIEYWGWRCYDSPNR